MQFEFTGPQTEFERLFGGSFRINIHGNISPGDDEKFFSFLRAVEPPPRTPVYINSGGGNVEAAIEIGRLIRDHWFSTNVGLYLLDSDKPVEFFAPKKFIKGLCASAATLIYLGGKLRYIDPNSKFGVHRFSFKNPTPDDIGKSQILSSRIARYVSDMGIGPEFLELSSSTDHTSINFVSHDKLRQLNVVTDGEIPVEWTVQAKDNLLYVRGERDLLYGHHQIIIGYTKESGYFLHAVIESQGRERELCEFPLVECLIGYRDEDAVDVSQHVERSVAGIYTNVFMRISREEALKISRADGVGMRIRAAADAPIFLGIAPMSMKGSEDLLRSFIENLG